METAVALQVVGAQMDHIESIRALLEPLMGSVPALNCRLEVMLGADKTVITVTDTEITVRDEAEGRVVASGDWDLARAALKGSQPDAPPA